MKKQHYRYLCFPAFTISFSFLAPNLQRIVAFPHLLFGNEIKLSTYEISCFGTTDGIDVYIIQFIRRNVSGTPEPFLLSVEMGRKIYLSNVSPFSVLPHGNTFWVGGVLPYHGSVMGWRRLVDLMGFIRSWK